MTVQHQPLKRITRFTHLHIPLERDVFTYLGACFGIGLAVSLLLITLVLLLTMPVRADNASAATQYHAAFITYPQAACFASPPGSQEFLAMRFDISSLALYNTRHE